MTDNKYFLWAVDMENEEPVYIHVDNNEECPRFDLNDIGVLFGYDPEEVFYLFRHQIGQEQHGGPNQTFVQTMEGIYVSILIPLLLAKTSVMDGRMDQYKAWDLIGAVGKIVEQIMPHGEMYMNVMVGKAHELMQEAFGE